MWVRDGGAALGGALAAPGGGLRHASHPIASVRDAMDLASLADAERFTTLDSSTVREVADTVSLPAVLTEGLGR